MQCSGFYIRKLPRCGDPLHQPYSGVHFLHFPQGLGTSAWTAPSDELSLMAVNEGPLPTNKTFSHQQQDGYLCKVNGDLGKPRHDTNTRTYASNVPHVHMTGPHGNSVLLWVAERFQFQINVI